MIRLLPSSHPPRDSPSPLPSSGKNKLEKGIERPETQAFGNQVLPRGNVGLRALYLSWRGAGSKRGVGCCSEITAQILQRRAAGGGTRGSQPNHVFVRSQIRTPTCLLTKGKEKQGKIKGFKENISCYHRKEAEEAGQVSPMAQHLH